VRGDQYDGTGLRSQKRKRKTADKILNISIGVVVLLILLVGGQLLLGGNSSDPVVSDKLEGNEENNTETVDENLDEAAETNTEEPEAVEQEGEAATEGAEQEQTTNDSASETATVETNSSEAPQTGEWKPIGTVQSEPFAAVYDREHINWEEMTRAFQYATGLGDDMTLWRVGNGGDHKSAVGIVANAATRMTPYQVRIEWVTNEGWMPVSVVQLEENPYYSGSATNEETTSEDNDGE
jgi:hypothetical protein